ncbi:MAG: phosphomannomutase [Desulfobulbaceae bacterium]|nr:phosphomannomutase [Desulfobulbaceae bacterium]
MHTELRCITPYDVRGQVPDTFNEDIAARIALAFAELKRSEHLILGQDVRLSSPSIAAAVCTALLAHGCDVTDIGLCGTEEMYHAVFNGTGQGIDGGIMLTASHNPASYNGMKLVGKGASPISADNGLIEIADMAARMQGDAPTQNSHLTKEGHYSLRRDKDAYISDIIKIAAPERMRPLKLVVNSGNGCAGPVLDLLAPHLPFTFIRLQHEPDGHFPNGVPNPLLPDRRAATAKAVNQHRADMGIAWDGDFDRCFLFDENGSFIEGYYIVGLLAEAMLHLHPGATILHDPRLVWNTQDIVQKAGGKPIMVRTGHSFIKEAMRHHNAVYGGEMSAHHYFRDFGYCDSGMLPWLLVCRLLAEKGQPLSALCAERVRAYPVSGEINTSITVAPAVVLEALKTRYADGELDETDGISVSYPRYRFNVRPSNTEPLLRLNVETRADARLLKDKTEELLGLIRSFA